MSARHFLRWTVQVESGRLVALIAEGLEWDRVNFTIQHQEQTEWCWAAVSTSIVKFYDASSPWTQCQVVGAELNCATCCENGSSAACNRWWYLDRALSRTGTFVALENAPSTGLGPAPREIKAGRPVAVRIGWKGGSGHAIVIEGCRRDGNRVALEDPWYGSSELPTKSFRTAYQGNGSWTHTYLTKAP